MPRNRFAQFSHGFFGHDGQPPSAILANSRSQLLSYDTVSFAEDLATHAAKAGEEYTVAVASSTVHTASRLILATGLSDDLSALPGLQERWAISVLHCFYCHGYEVAGRRLGVLVSNERALQTAMLLPDWSEHVTLFTNGVLPLGPGQLAGLRLDDGRIVPVDAVFISPRTRVASSLAEQLRSNSKKARPALLSVLVRTSRLPYRVSTLRAMLPVRGMTPRGPPLMELLREFPPTNRFRWLSPYVADSLASIPSEAQLSLLLSQNHVIPTQQKVYQALCAESERYAAECRSSLRTGSPPPGCPCSENKQD